MSNPYYMAKCRTQELASASMENYDFNKILKLRHRDGSEFLWNGCYYELVTFEKVKFIIVAPEHHPAIYYELEDVVEFKET